MDEINTIRELIDLGVPGLLMIAVVALWRENRSLQNKIDRLTGVIEAISSKIDI